MVSEIFEREKEKLKFIVKWQIFSENPARVKECIYSYPFILVAIFT